ncbi:hypothetical protein [Mycolicibacterium sp.]|uniref:hypothetical protein n=1 Tax=Mycolicibacterium sp. TaxID=2320850 RepID=UPI001A22D2A8|nr:hypothetical protein [Mycolicibacterium sp.]MBJ7400342.1 hypothetical protein [Mycolicibacterium sp.]
MNSDAVCRSGRFLAGLTRVLLALVAVLAIPLGLPASAQADTGPDTVTVGVFINDLQDIDLASENFTVDFYVWMRWKNPKIDPSLTIEAMNSEGTQNTTSSATGGVSGEPLYDAPLDMPDGSKYQVLRYQGVFSRKMNLEKYPFDTQVLEMVFEDKRKNASVIEFVPDTTPVTINDGGAMSIPGYVLGKPSLIVVPHKYPTNFGDISANASTPYSRVIVALPVTRDVLPYLVKIVLPIFIVILITSLIYLLPARLEDARAGIGITAMLTIVALQWTTDASLPSVEYLTMLDLVYIVSMIYILASMAYTVLASRRNRAEMAQALTAKLDRRVGIISLVAYLAILGITLAYYLSQHYNVLDQYL